MNGLSLIDSSDYFIINNPYKKGDYAGIRERLTTGLKTLPIYI